MLRSTEAASVKIEDYAETVRGHRVLRLVGKGDKPATMPLPVPVLRAMDACKGDRTEGYLIRRPLSGKPINRRDVYKMSRRICKDAGFDKLLGGHALRASGITCAMDGGVTLRDAQILARHADPRQTERYDRARHNLDRHGVHILTAYVAGS